jgi:hypothetical protein
MYMLLLGVLFSTHSLYSQELKTGTDSTAVKIGAEIKLILNVAVDTSSVVIFPEMKPSAEMKGIGKLGQMGSLDVIESYPVDTTFNQAKMTLIKKYGLTQFDSGAYTIPPQKVFVDGKEVFSDSLQVTFKDVLVDTTKQKMYDIKPIVEVAKPTKNYGFLVLYILLGLVFLGLLLYVIFFRKTKKEKAAANKLPPFEEAIESLKALDQTAFLENEEYKQYYTQLTDVLKTYLEEEVYENALENTSDEIISALAVLRKAGDLPISSDAILELRNVLKTADLVKFAKYTSDQGTAKVDRATIEQLINEAKKALPEPSEEELLRNEQYRIAQEKKRRRKKIVYAAITGSIVIILTIAGFVIKYGYDEVKDRVIGHPTKELLESDWIRSEYGEPAIVVSTPKVLKRIPIQNSGTSEEHFGYGSLLNNFYIKVGIVNLPDNVAAAQESDESEDQENQKPAIDLEQVNELTLQSMEQMGAKDVLVKQEAYETVNGFEGIKAHGSFNMVNEKLKTSLKSRYEIITFSQETAIQQIVVVYQEEDAYAEKIVQKILASVELQKSEE